MYTCVKRSIFAGIALYSIAWCDQLMALFSGKTELDLNGIEVIRESAEILARSIETFPSKATAIAIIGLIFAAQGIYLLGRALVDILCSWSEPTLGTSGRVRLLVGALFTSWGLVLSLYCTTLAYWLFG